MNLLQGSEPQKNASRHSICLSVEVSQDPIKSGENTH